jgi:hypothetical protein
MMGKDSDGFSFDDNDDDGIFEPPIVDEGGILADPHEVTGAAGDMAAAEDMLAKNWVPGVQMNIGADGLVEVVEMDGSKSVLDPPPPVDAKNFLCLAGPCRHYTENAQLLQSGPDHDADEHIEVGRWCGFIRTWAEQTDLTELEMFGCNGYEPCRHGDPSVIRDAVTRNAMELSTVRRQAIDAGVNLGICAVGPCEDFVEMLGRTPTENDQVYYRWCGRLAGLGRLYDLRERPVLCCTGWKPVASSPTVASAAVYNLERIAKYRKQMADRGQED